ncbi:CDP-diacylglycerol--glycerol-3-phosphate 3-phosphatidyltransferase [Campylobacter sp. RM9344]|uniref:CDP-diacylglycerol--glycerol-3-phosphate 3-phosphatidyltransferase n=1 Tax=Campylobacter californiensis TaxID=1032243 RepID=A0AAW3ZW88_9BACT|nr:MULTISPECIES: CDP-diacylglycerol--glycerol-3-phosphate 3-phosphatidyltransferase [unclassified Campylobacter]MBE2984362.1 CDP-diacylglycerol--glycerol-3-phosphate 3-phosphatidyltransferase [Campylobacter sp. RM6883]MBE2985884.1 CDP-diacylglycerol--glycerol-3-phosphate 3-phosphatidyltransferase [Campylobacter sp. RM12919]MBE2988085.1 CDP-diacylglycerol--glycerol-3-phosphate 3-phosphatidyltransferase [Campylobacter sp. RM12920]MBE2994771.1 CDP-diacylglycerol--glycerol-3-phosphate 3-phosphatidy
MSLNLPNALAIFRIALAPVMFYLLVNAPSQLPNIHISWINFFAGFVFVIASVTDFFDGYIARAWDQKTKLGAILDPLADKMLTLAAFIGLMMLGRANPWAIYLILIREFFITGFRVVIASEGLNVAASMAGKVKTVFQMIAIGWLTMQWWGAEILLWVAVALTMYSGYEYIAVYVRAQKH